MEAREAQARMSQNPIGVQGAPPQAPPQAPPAYERVPPFEVVHGGPPPASIQNSEAPPVVNPETIGYGPQPPVDPAPPSSPADPLGLTPDDWKVETPSETDRGDQTGRDDYELKILRQELEQTRASLQAEREARALADRKRLEDEKALAEYTRIKAEKEIENLYSGENNSFATVDPEDAKKIAGPLYAKFLEQRELMERQKRELEAKQQEFLNTRAYDKVREERERKNNDFNVRLRQAVPDIDYLINTRAYTKFLNTPHTPGSTVTNEAFFNHELSNGNYDYVIERYKQFAQGRPNPADIAQVSAVTTGDKAPASVPDAQKEYLSLKERVEMRRSGKIKNRAEYVKMKYGDADPRV
jgi:hypothetical protein